MPFQPVFFHSVVWTVGLRYSGLFIDLHVHIQCTFVMLFSVFVCHVGGV